jgi:hypothetical protein
MTDVPNFVTDPGPAIWTSASEGSPESIQLAMLDGRQWEVRTVWSVDSGRLEPVKVSVIGAGNARVVADVLRRLPIGTMQQTARRVGAESSERFKAARSDWSPDVVAFLDTIGRGHRGVATTPEEIAEVARVYLKAWGNGEPVTEAVAKAFMISPSTAGKRIMKARRAGLLDSATRIASR